MSKKIKKQKSSLITILVVILSIVSYYISVHEEIDSSYSLHNKNTVTSDLKIYYLDVGQADSILISNNNHNMLIDAGNNEDGPKLVKYIKEELNITKFDYVVGTHPHEDHIGGLDDIINNFEIENILLPEVTTTTKTFEDVLDCLANKNLDITIPIIDSTFKLGEADLSVIYTGTDDENLNNSSIILKMIFGNYSYLFTGDAEKEVEDSILRKNINVDVLKVGHHGSSTSSSESFLNKVTPSYAIISVAKENSYNHPSKETIDRLKKYTSNIYMTSELGTILLTSNGKTINIDNFKTNTNG